MKPEIKQHRLQHPLPLNPGSEVMSALPQPLYPDPALFSRQVFRIAGDDVLKDPFAHVEDGRLSGVIQSGKDAKVVHKPDGKPGVEIGYGSVGCIEVGAAFPEIGKQVGVGLLLADDLVEQLVDEEDDRTCPEAREE